MQCLWRTQTLIVPLGRLFQSSSKFYSSEAQKLFTLYTNDNCKMCAYFKRRMDAYRMRGEVDWNYEEVELRTAPKEIFEKYKNDIPVLVYNDELLLKHKFSGSHLEERLSDLFPKKK